LAGGIVANNSYPVEFFNENIMIQNSLLNAALKFKVKRTIFLGTSCIYPYKSEVPIKEEYLLTGKLHPTNEAYAIAKIAGIKLCESLYREYNLDVVCLMPTNIYGINDKYDHEKSHVIPGMILKFLEARNKNIKRIELWGDGTPEREFLYSDDLAKAIVVCLEKYDADQQINIGTGIDITIRDLAQKIANITGFQGELSWDFSREDGTPQKILDIQKITNLGWKPSISLDQGIKLTVEWYLENK
jgi:GDP-L-fucose synthase